MTQTEMSYKLLYDLAERAWQELGTRCNSRLSLYLAATRIDIRFELRLREVEERLDRNA